MQTIVRKVKAALDPILRVGESAVSQHLYQEAQERANEKLTKREIAGEALVGGSFLAAALGLAVTAAGHRPISVLALVLLIAAFAIVSRVEFDVGGSYTVPSQIVFVPMLLLLPPALAPLCAVAGLVLAKLPDCIRRRRPPSRVLLAFSDAWFSIGPAAILTAAGAPSASEAGAGLLVACALSQIVCDFAASASREFVIAGDLRGQLEENAWIYLVDLLLWPLGILTALAAEHHVWAIALVVSFAGLLRVFSFERKSRLDQLVDLTTAYRGTAVLLGDFVEADHKYTGSHSKGVVELAAAVARRMGLDHAAHQRVEFGALLHDVGKIAIPKEIIDKPGPLDDGEWELMKTHTIEGERMLQQVGGLLDEVGRVVRSSHEHYDGNGYPDGLAGAEIPIESRIVSCCDAYSAMTTDRSYRAARSSEEAIKELQRCAFTQFDPEVVLAVIAVLERSTEPATLAREDEAVLPPVAVPKLRAL